MLSWTATGRLIEHWGKVGGRDGLARATGIEPTTLSSYNTGKRKLGLRNAERIAAALDVTVFDLGAPTVEDIAEQSVAVLDRLAAVEAELSRALRELDDLRRQQGDAE